MSGFIKLNRKILNWEWYKDNNVKVLFLHLLLKANWKPTIYKGKEIPRGSLITTIPTLSTDLGLTIQQIRTAIIKLKSTDEITDYKIGKSTVFIIQNYGKYQDDNRLNNGLSTDYQLDEQPINNSFSNANLTDTINRRNNNSKNIETKKDICCSEPVPVSEPVTEPTADEAESLFEELWKAYPQKRGKGSVSKTVKKKLLKIGREQMLRAIDRYVSECKEQGRYYKNGSTFFNSGYLDYLDDIYTPISESPQKGNALDERMKGQKVKKAESMKGQQRGTDYDAMIAQSLKPETEAEREERKRKAISQNVQRLLGIKEEV